MIPKKKKRKTRSTIACGINERIIHDVSATIFGELFVRIARVIATFFNISAHLFLQVVVVATTVVIAGAYRNEREVVSFSAATSPYHKSRSTRNFFFNQPFVETTIDQHRTPSHIPVRDRTVSQQALRHVSTKEQSVYSPSFPIYSHRPFKQSSFHMVTTFRDEPSSLRDAPFSKNQESRGRPARLFRNSPLGGQSAPFVASEEILEEEASAYRSRGPSRKQLFTTEAPFKNLFHAQSSAGGRTPSFQEEAAFVESPVRDSMKFHRDDSYDKPIDSYGRQKNSETVPYERPSMYMEYGKSVGIFKRCISTNSRRRTQFNFLPFRIFKFNCA